jgi:hypothetical protein
LADLHYLNHDMNNLDVLLNKLIHDHNRRDSTSHVEDISYWIWSGAPGPYSDVSAVPYDLDENVLNEIRRASIKDCLRSESSYVMACKLWVIDRTR